METVENVDCGKWGLWKMGTVEMRTVENGDCGRDCGKWMGSVVDGECSKLRVGQKSPLGSNPFFFQVISVFIYCYCFPNVL